MEKTIFERIIAREIPATIEYEDNDVIVIHDIAPSAPVHLLIIPKRVITSIDALEDADAALIGKIHLVARDMARTLGIAESGYRVVSNCKTDGGQTVFHLHMHLLGGQQLGHMNTALASHAPEQPMATQDRSSTLRDVVLFVAVAVGLAIGFNTMNPKSIAWLKPEFERQSATQNDIEKYLPQVPVKQKEIIQQAPVQQVADAKTQTLPEQAPAKTNTSIVNPANNLPDQSVTTSAFTPEPGVVREINYDMFVRLLEGTKNYLIDARGSDKFSQGHINGASNFYGGEVQSRIPDILANVPRDRVILIYCDGGECELSHHVADVLKQFGYGPMFIFTGGWAEWTSKRK